MTLFRRPLPFVPSAALLFVSLVLCGCVVDNPPIYCQDPDTKCYIDHAVDSINIVRSNIQSWSLWHVGAQIAIAVFGLVATLAIALQEESNKRISKPIGIVATTLVTFFTSALVSFHVPDNVDKLIDIVDGMTTATNVFDEEIGKISVGKNKDEVATYYRDNEQFRNSYAQASTSLANSFQKAKTDMLRINGSAARLNVQLNKSTEALSKNVK